MYKLMLSFIQSITF